MVRLAAVLVLIFSCLNAAAAPVPGRPGKDLNWGEIIDPDKDCEITPEKSKVTIVVPGKAHDFAGELHRWNAPRILSPAQGDFVLEVKVSGDFMPTAESSIAGRRGYNGAGLMVIHDKDNHVSLHRGVVNFGDRVRHYANFELRKDAELVISRFELDLEAKETFLRLKRQGSRFFAEASHDGEHWKSYDEPIVAEFPARVEVGVEVVNSSVEPLRCVLEGYKNSSARPAKK